MSSDGATEVRHLPEVAETSANMRPLPSADAEAPGPQGRTSARSGAYAVLCQVLQNNGEQLEARCRKSEAWWMQGVVRWKARLQEDLQASLPHGADGKEEDSGRDRRQGTQFGDDLRPTRNNAPTLSCMNEFVLLRRVYGRGHLAKVTSALALTASLLPVALKTYIVRALKRARTAVFGAEGIHMTNEYEKVRREIAVQSSLQHPNVCPLYGVINDVETGCLHLVLQLLPYRLMEWVEENRVYTARPADATNRKAVRSSVSGSVSVLVYTEDAVRRILTQVLDALDYVHSQNIVHKDIKPENILSATPPSSSELILVRLACTQAWQPTSDREDSSPDGSLRGIGILHQRDLSPSRAACEPDVAFLAGRTNNDKDRAEGGSHLLHDLMEEEGTVCSGDVIGRSCGIDADVGCRARPRLDDPELERLYDEMPEDMQDWCAASSFSEETDFSESDSEDDEHGVCGCCDLRCTCTLVAQVPPSSPAFQTSLAVVQKHLSPYAAYARQVRQSCERSTMSNSKSSCESHSHAPASHCRAEKKASSAADAASAAETTHIETDRHDGGAQHPITEETQLGRSSRLATAHGTDESSLPGGNPGNSAVAMMQMVGGAAGSPPDKTAADFLIILARRITMCNKRAGFLRPLFQVIFEGEAESFPAYDKDAGDKLGMVGAGAPCLNRKRMLLEDIQLAGKIYDLANSHTNVTESSHDQGKFHQTVEPGAEAGTSSTKQAYKERAMQGRKRSREPSGTTCASQEVRHFSNSGVSPESEQAEGVEEDCVSNVTHLPNMSEDFVRNSRPAGSPTSTVNWRKETGSVFDMDKGACWKLVDFSSACVADDDRLTIWDSEGTRHFTPPECLGVSSEDGWAGGPRDLWSVGVVLYCMFFGTLPFRGSTGLELSISIMNDTLTFPDHRELSASAKDLLSGLLCKDPSKRLTSEQLRRHPWLSGVASNVCERTAQMNCVGTSS